MNNQISNTKEEQKGEDFFEEVTMALISIIILPFIIMNRFIEIRAGLAKTWKLFDKKLKALQLIIPSSILLLMCEYFAFKLILRGSFITGGALLILSWIFALPISVLFGVHKLQKIASAIANGTYDLSKAATVKRAMMLFGFLKAKEISIAHQAKFPRRSSMNKPIIAVSAQSPDFRLKQDIKRQPDVYVLNQRKDGDWITFPVEGIEYPHHLVIGATGSGKTTLLSRMTLTALQEDYRVIFMDFKGGDQERNLITGIGKFLDRNIKIVTWPNTGINLFTGTPEEIFDKVLGFLPAPTGGASDYYRSRLVKAMKAVIVNSNLPAPKSAEEIIERIYNGTSYSSLPEDRNFFTQKDKGTPIGHDMSYSLASYLSALTRKGGESTNSGFVWGDDWDLAFIQLNSTKEEYIRLGSAILSDFNFWLRSQNRYQNDKPILLIIDEAGVLSRIQGSPALTDLIARARSRNVSVVLSSQTLSGIGEEGDEILKTGPVRWLGKTSSPEEMVMAGGTKEVIETSYQYEDGQWNGSKSARQQEAFVISPTAIRHLDTFFWNISDGGKAIWAYAPPIN